MPLACQTVDTREDALQVLLGNDTTGVTVGQ